MDPKPRPNRERYIEILRAMTPEERLAKASELSAMARQIFIEGMRVRYPDATDAEFDLLVRDRLEKCHNRNY